MSRMAATTEITLDPPEFDNYTIGVDGEITFCLKELRAILNFTDSIPQQLSISFEQASQPVVFSFDSPQEYTADFVMATLATTTASNTTTHHQRNNRPSASTTKPSVSHNRQPTPSVSKQKLSTNNDDIVITPPAAVSIAETPYKDDNVASWLRERTVVNNGISDHYNGEPVGGNKPVEEDNKEFVTHSHDGETDNLLDSLFDDIINDDIADDVYGFAHHPHSSTGVQCNNSTDKPKQQLMFSQSDFPHSPVAMDTGDVTSKCIMLPPTPPTKKFRSHFYNPLRDKELYQDSCSTYHTVLAPDSDEEETP